MTQHLSQSFDILEGARQKVSRLKPSEWTEKNRVMGSQESPYPGPFRYDRAPYQREIVDCFSPNHPARIIAIRKGAQIGLSTGVIESAIGWIIAENPGPVMYLSGHAELSEEAMNGKIDSMIESCGLRHLIRPNVRKKKNQRTGDTAKMKEFPGGSLVAGSANNHKLLRQRSIKFGFVDDFDAVRNLSKESGSTTSMIETRFAAYHDQMKLAYISTPELKQGSNIDGVFEQGDQRYFHIPCPCCSQLIVLFWECDLEGSDQDEKAGMIWELNERNELVHGSVKYVCQKCGGAFDDSTKKDFLAAGKWIPTAQPKQIGYYSYHISSLYAPPGMKDWEAYVRQYLEANPPEGDRIEKFHQSFLNVVLGESYEPTGATPKANQLQKNTRTYLPGVIPDVVSESDGNGKIVMLTCACDLNGTEDDARLDWEVVAWAENEVSYSVKHGSIGTFIPRESDKSKKIHRDKMTYKHGKKNSVWPELNKILSQVWPMESGRKMKILITGVDCGFHTNYAYAFIDNTNFPVVGVRGDKENQYRKFGIDVPIFKPAKERGKLYLLDVNHIKDGIAEDMKLIWDQRNDTVQPPGFMNYPTPNDGLYTYNGFFKHYESEQRVIDVKEGEGVASLWSKKSTISQNHLWDVRVYNQALRKILMKMVLKELKLPNGTWADYVRIILGKK